MTCYRLLKYFTCFLLLQYSDIVERVTDHTVQESFYIFNCVTKVMFLRANKDKVLCYKTLFFLDYIQSHACRTKKGKNTCPIRLVA